MKNIKVYLIISFLIIIIPGEHVALPIGITIFIGFIQSIWSVFYEEFNKEMYISIINTFLIIISLLFVLSKNKLINLFGIIIQYIYLFFIYDFKYLKYWYYTVPTLIYIILSIILVYKLFSKKQIIK